MHSRFMTTDELGNVYVVRDDNSLVRFDENGDSSAFFRSIQNGEIASVDATNPMNIVVYYPAYSRVVILDRQLAQKIDLDLRRLNIANTSVVAASADGNLWVYDQFNARLRKIDQQLNEVVQSNDVRIETNAVPTPSFMIERDWKVFLCDTVRGIFTFDRYANYVNTLAVYGVKHLQVFGSQLIYRNADSLVSWDRSKVHWNVLQIPRKGRIINAALIRNTLYVLYEDALILYRFKQH
ncbi:MAG TPA: hypothetical protein PL009_13405 [Flavipsychrobacter sp.]|nr:hypothetical protein [Flavipsychrobacter sp.]